MDPASVFFAPGFLIPTLISIIKEIQEQRRAAAQNKKIDYEVNHPKGKNV